MRDVTPSHTVNDLTLNTCTITSAYILNVSPRPFICVHPLTGSHGVQGIGEAE